MRSDGTSFIYFQFFPKTGQRIFLNTNIAVPPKYWDKRYQCIKDNLPANFGDYQKLNEEIFRLYRLAEDLIRLVEVQDISNPGLYIKDKFHPSLDLDQLARNEFQLTTAHIPAGQKKKAHFFRQLEDYIECKRNKVKPATATVYSNMIGHFAAFESHRGKPVTFDGLDYQFYEDFIDFLTHDYRLPRTKIPAFGLRVNTIGRTIHQFRIFIKDRVKRKIIPAIDLSDFKVPTEETDAVYLSYEEIGQIYNLDLSEYPDLIPARNLFVLGCLTGLRFSDYSTLKPEDLQEDMLHKKQEKSVHWVVIPLRKEAKDIFTEQFKTQIPTICNAEFNKKIKDIAKLAGFDQTIKFSYRKGNRMIEVKRPKWAWITSHTARRSFCTNEFLAGTPVLLIMKISGHKREKDFYKYIRVSPQEAALRIKVLWMERGDSDLFKNPQKKAINMMA
jgi:integrase